MGDYAGKQSTTPGTVVQTRAAESYPGKRAYATGNHTVFAGAPDLHTAAHEAAHVVQQRAGVHLSGGVGQVGDAYERHADAVADRVVNGQSAADLLAPGAQGVAEPRTGASVQKQAAAQPPGQAPAAGPGGNGGDDATPNVYALYYVGELDRASFLAFEVDALSHGAKHERHPQLKGGLGATSSVVSNSKPPTIETQPVQNGEHTTFRLKHTHAEMAPIKSAVTCASEFVEGTVSSEHQEGSQCAKGEYPVRWILKPDGVAKAKAGEQEHCEDFRVAFDVTLASYADTINKLAAANRVYATGGRFHAVLHRAWSR